MTMTDDELDAILARADAATPAPWFVLPERCGPDGQGIFNEDGGCICEVGDPYKRGDNHPQENMVFIAASRTDVPTLVAEVRSLRTDLAHARHWANRAIEHPALEIGDAEDEQARVYCDVDAHFTASDGWFIGQPVPS
jgi:hypothetical protein